MPAKDISRFQRLATNVLNIAPDEWEKVSFSWGFKLFLAIGHTLGHTAFLALFAGEFGVSSLPLFFAGSAVLGMLATAVTTPLLERVRKEYLLIGTALLGAVALIAAFMLSTVSIVSTAALGLFTVGAVMTQLGIVLSLFIEEQYSPFESQRTFPIIESAEVVGALIGGLLVSFFAARLHVAGLLLFWSVSFLCMAALIGIYQVRSQIVPQLSTRHAHERAPGLLVAMREGFGSLERVSFLRTVAWTVFLLSAMAKLIEFLYTAALAAGHGEHSGDALAHELGLYIVVFSTAAILLQLLASSRLIRRLGTIRSQMLSPLLSIPAFVAMAFSFTPVTAIAGRFVYDLTQTVAKDAYLLSFYAVSHRIRERAKALIEGWVIPLGAVLGTMTLPILATLHSPHLYQYLAGALAVGCLVMLWLFGHQRRHHSQLSILALNTGDEVERRTAVEILGDRGHSDARRHLLRRLMLSTETPDMKVKVLETLGRLQDESTIPAILDCLMLPNLTVKIAAVEALAAFPELGQRFFREAFTRYRIANNLRELFVAQPSARLKLAIMRVFAVLRDGEIIPFLLHVLEHGDPEVKADCIQVIGGFHDPNIIHYLRPYVQQDDPRLKSNALIALWQFESERLNLLVQLVGMLAKDDRNTIISTLYALGELQSHQELETILRHISHEDPKVRRHAAVALMKLGDARGIDALLPIILGADPMESWKARQMLLRVGRGQRNLLTRRLHQDVARRVNAILLPVRHDPHRLSRNELTELIRLYDLAEQHAEVTKLKKLFAEYAPHPAAAAHTLTAGTVAPAAGG